VCVGGGGETESAWYVDPYLAYCTSPGWYMMSVEQSVEWELVGETEVLGENLPQRHFAHHKSHMTWPGIEAGPPRTNHLSYGTALCKEVSTVLLFCLGDSQ
jgi:hypothetical protein